MTGGEKPEGASQLQGDAQVEDDTLSQTKDQTGESAKQGSGELDGQGMQELLSTAGTDLDGLIARLGVVRDVSENYKSFAGIDETMDGQVKFIYRMDSIE